MNLREEFHRLIDKLDEEELKGIYTLFSRMSNGRTGELWDNLTDEQKEELLLAYDESFKDENLIGHEKAKRQHAKWLKP